MGGLRVISLGIAAALAIALLSVMTAFADEVTASPGQTVSEEKAAVPDAASAAATPAANMPPATKSASEQASNARAEVTKPPATSKPRQTQLPLPPVRPVTLAQRPLSCWWCNGQMVLMLGVAY